MLEELQADALAIIPLRAGSKGLRNKNIRPMAGKPLYRHSVDQALRVFGRCSISTDIPDVLDWRGPTACQVVKRPAELAGDQTSISPVLVHLFQHLNRRNALPGIAVLMQATSPLRRDEDLRNAIALYREGRFGLVMSVVKADRSILKYGVQKDGRFIPVSRPDYCFSNRQSLPETVRPNGAIYVFSPQAILSSGGLSAESIGCVEMPEEYSIDIDNQADFEAAEQMLMQSAFREAS